MPMKLRPPSPEGIAEAANRINPVFLDTPFAYHDALDERLGCHAIAKVETLNPIRSFKGRGAEWFLETSASKGEPLVTASAGNFGQGLAYAARARGLPLTVFSAVGANPVKIDAMRRLGAEVRLEGEDFDAAKVKARQFAIAHGTPLVIDGDHPAIAEGAGTIARELLRQWTSPIDAILVPLGNGALATGIGAWIKAERPSTRVVAVAAEGAPAMARSWNERRIVETDRVDTIADGIAVRVPVSYALDTMRGLVDEVVLVSDDAIVRAMRLIHETLGLAVEPAGASGLAAIVADPTRFRGMVVATVLCGANLTTDQLRKYLFAG
jgi:threonine dehydratase